MSDLSAGSHDWSQHRKAQPVESLLPSSEDWIDLLPPEVFPGALATHYPRIVNIIAMLWDDRAGCSAYFDELFVDRRGGRQGFPKAVKRDLSKLRHHWYFGRWRLDRNVPQSGAIAQSQGTTAEGLRTSKVDLGVGGETPVEPDRWVKNRRGTDAGGDDEVATSVTITVEMADGRRREWQVGPPFLSALRRLLQRGINGKGIIDALITDDWPVVPRVVMISGVDENGERIMFRIPYT
jgi:hypothetical protein